MEKLEWRWECSSHRGCRAECAITLFPKNSPDKLPHRMLMTWLGGGMVQQLGPERNICMAVTCRDVLVGCRERE